MLLKRISVTSLVRWNSQSRLLRNTHKEVQVHDPVEYQIIKQKQSVNNHFIDSYFTTCDSASFSSQVSITSVKNMLLKLESNQSTKQVSITMKKNKLFKRGNNQSTNQVSVTMQDSRIIAYNLTKDKLTLRNLLSTQSKNYRTPFFPVHPSGAYSDYTNTTRF